MFSADLGGYTEPLPAATDPPFQKVALLLHGDGTNGAQNNTFVDYSYPGGYAVSFDGTGDYLSSPLNSVNIRTAFTIESWCYITTRTSFIQFCGSTTSSAGQSLYLQEAGGAVYFGDGSSNNITFSSTLLPLNQWFHCACTFDGTTYRIFINGSSVGTSTTLLANNTLVSTQIGARTVSATAYITGYISNFRIVKGTALYTSNFTPSNQPLTAVSGTSLLTCQSATIVDNSPNAFTITVNGDAAAVSSKTITRTGNVAQGTFSPFSLADGQWSNYFDGSGDYLTTPYSTTAFDWWTSDFTLEAWVYPTTLTGWGYLDGPYAVPRMIGNSAYNGTTSNWSFGPYTDGTVIFRYWNGSATNAVISTQTVSINTWNHIAVTKTASGIIIWVNGVGTTATAISGTPVSSTSYPLIIGQINNTSITGYLSNLRIVKGTAVYTSNFTPPTSALTAISGTSLLTCQSNRFKDNSSNNFTITCNGDTKVTAFSPFAPSAAYSASTNGGSGYFDGSGDYLTVASNAAFDQNSSNWTIESWVYLTAPVNASNGTCVVGQETSNYLKLSIKNSGVAIIDQASAGIKVTGTTVLKLNTWYHLAAVRNSNTVTLFVNGISEGTPATITSYAASANTMYIAKRPDTADSLSGYISNLRIVKGTAVYTTNFTPPTAPLTAITNTQLLLNCTNAGIIDNAGKNDIETVGNAQVSTSVKKYGTGSMYFDGTGDWLVIPASTQLTLNADFTIEFWVNLAATTDMMALSNSGGTQQLFRFNYSTANTVSVYVGAFWFNQQSSVPSGTWTHVALTRSGSTAYLFINGVSKGTYTGTGVSTTLNIERVGVFGSGGAYPFNGYIDDLRITKGQALYTSNFTPPTSALPNV